MEVNVRSGLGLPIPKTEVKVARWSIGTLERPSEVILDDALSDFSGVCEVQVKDYYPVRAWAPGFAPNAASPPERSSVDLVLTKGRTVTGTIVLPNGEPAAGARVKAVSFRFPFSDREQEKLGFDRFKQYPYFKYRDVGFPDAKNLEVKTDKTGGFRLDQLPEFRVRLLVRFPGYESTLLTIEAADDDGLAVFPGGDLLPSGFEYQLKEAHSFVFKGRHLETLKPEKIKRAWISPASRSSLLVSPEIEVDPSESFELSMRSSDNEKLTLWLEPKNPRLLGQAVDLSVFTPGETTEHVVQFQPGKWIEGKVVSQSDGSPIEGAEVAWYFQARSPAKEALDRQFPAQEVKTDKHGNFGMAVPECDGRLVVVGGVEGFRGTGVWGERRGNLPRRWARQYSQVLKNGAPEGGGPIQFELFPSNDIKVRVVGPNGRPFENAVVSLEANNAKAKRWNRLALEEFTRKKSFELESEGEVTISDWYGHAVFLNLANQKFVVNDEPIDPKDAKEFGYYPSKLEAFAAEGLLQGQAFVPLPKLEDGQPIDVEIQLEPASSLSGRLVSQDGEPISDVELSVRPLIGDVAAGSQLYSTMTREDGRFLVTKLPPRGSFDLRLKSPYFKLAGEERTNRILVEIQDETVAGKLVTIPDVYCLDLSALDMSMDLIDVQGMTQVEAINSLRDAIDAKLQAIPKLEAEFYPDIGARLGGRDPLVLFEANFEKWLQENLRDVLAIDPKSPQALSVIASVAEATEFRNRPKEFRRLNELLFEQLLTHHPDADLAQGLLIKLAVDSRKREAIFSSVKNADTLANVGYELLGSQVRQTLGKYVAGEANSNGVGVSGTDKTLERIMLKLKALPSRARKAQHEKFLRALSGWKTSLPRLIERSSDSQKGEIEVNQDAIDGLLKRLDRFAVSLPLN